MNRNTRKILIEKFSILTGTFARNKLPKIICRFSPQIMRSFHKLKVRACNARKKFFETEKHF